MNHRPRLAAAFTWCIVTVVAVGGCGSGSTSSNRALALTDARAFLAKYVDASGRVIRRDQGGDTVSEGQGYGLLLAYVTNERKRFAAIRSWTMAHLQLSDGLFAYQWAAGDATSSTPAADADTQIAWALDLAGTRWHVPSYLAEAKRTAVAIAQQEIGYDTHGRPTMSAGPWAIRSPQPVTVEPGYWTYPADSALARLTGDNRWRALAAADLAHLRLVAANGKSLPPDWAGVSATVTPISPPSNPGSPPASGQDGLRALAWAACTPGGRPLDRAWWRLIASTADQSPLVRALSGAPVNHNRSPLSAVAAAAAAAAAGQSARRDSLLADADQIAKQYPTYYGSAWAALGRILLVPGLLPGCA